MSKRIILIGGMPTAGKSTTARAVAKHFDLPWISTDQICIIMQSIADPAQNPILFFAHNVTAEEYLENRTPQQVADEEYAQDQIIWHGVQAFIDRNFTWKNGFVVEGVGILPELVSKTYSDNPDVQAVFLSDSDHDRTRDIIYSRGVFTDASLYSDHVKDKELEWVKIFDQKIRDEADKFNYPIIEVSKDANDIEKVLRALN